MEFPYYILAPGPMMTEGVTEECLKIYGKKTEKNLVFN